LDKAGRGNFEDEVAVEAGEAVGEDDDVGGDEGADGVGDVADEEALLGAGIIEIEAAKGAAHEAAVGQGHLNGRDGMEVRIDSDFVGNLRGFDAGAPGGGGTGPTSMRTLARTNLAWESAHVSSGCWKQIPA